MLFWMASRLGAAAAETAAETVGAADARAGATPVWRKVWNDAASDSGDAPASVAGVTAKAQAGARVSATVGLAHMFGAGWPNYRRLLLSRHTAGRCGQCETRLHVFGTPALQCVVPAV